jgi:HEAT repeat protein
LGDKQAVTPLLAKLDDQDADVGATTAMVLHVFGEPKGFEALTRFIASDNVEIRQAAVRAYAHQKELTDQRLLSRDLDGSDPWLDPNKPVSDDQVAKAAKQLDISPEEVRSRFEKMASDLNLKLGWRS